MLLFLGFSPVSTPWKSLAYPCSRGPCHLGVGSVKRGVGAYPAQPLQQRYGAH